MLMVLSLVAAACADEEPETNGGDDPVAEEEVDFKACQVTDTGGVDDRSFNQTAYEGMQRAEEEFGIEIDVLESQSDADFEPNINTFLQADCDLIVTVGFLLGEATATAAEANPDQLFAIVDVDFADEDFNDVTYPNARELTFATDEAAFLAGVLASGMSESGVLGTFGGINIPPVTIFENGFEAGMNYWNAEAGAAVELLGWSSADQDGLFTGDFEDQDKGKQVAQQLLDEGADIIMPVAGPVGLGSAVAVREAGNASMIWVDTDGCESASDICDLLLTSVMKNMDNAVYDTIVAAMNDEFEGGLYVGTLENEGVGLAPYHDFDSVIPDALKETIEEVRAGIIDGSISVGG
ncbi:MAG: BMP family ABC transporter substrate-binding protein [Actinobacteria bacterium]|nr:BMP family ABC transporter substrate-binding protein [Actinomycetota bacterium]